MIGLMSFEQLSEQQIETIMANLKTAEEPIVERERCGFGLAFEDGHNVELSYDEVVEEKKVFKSDEEFRDHLNYKLGTVPYFRHRYCCYQDLGWK